MSPATRLMLKNTGMPHLYPVESQCGEQRHAYHVGKAEHQGHAYKLYGEPCHVREKLLKGCCRQHLYRYALLLGLDVLTKPCSADDNPEEVGHAAASYRPYQRQLLHVGRNAFVACSDGVH